MADRIEFYNGNMIAVVESSMFPRDGDLISIRGETWRVVHVAFALDYADEGPHRRCMRCNVDVELADKEA